MTADALIQNILDGLLLSLCCLSLLVMLRLPLCKDFQRNP